MEPKVELCAQSYDQIKHYALSAAVSSCERIERRH